MKNRKNYNAANTNGRSVNNGKHMMLTKSLADSIYNIITGQHVQKSGQAMYDENKYFIFLPDNPVCGSLTPFRGMGMGQLNSDGTFDFIRQPRQRAQSVLIRKLAHGRVSQTKDGAIQLTIKVYQDEGVNISQTIAQEALIAKDAIVDWQMKR